MTTIIVVSVVASYGVTIYNQSSEKAKERQAVQNLMMAHAQQQIYYAKTGKYWTDVAGTTNLNCLNLINTNLQLSIVNGDDFSYSCWGDGASQFEIRASRKPDNNYRLRVTEDSLGININNPCCESGTCQIAAGC